MDWPQKVQNTMPMDPDQFDPNNLPGLPRFIGGVFGLVFLGIGLTVIGFLWSAPFGAFHSPPLVFRVFGSFIALAFVAVGGGTAYAAIFGKPQQRFMQQVMAMRREQMKTGRDAASKPPTQGGYSCDSCGAPLDSSADVSPHGDVKCAHCDRWFNVHAQ